MPFLVMDEEIICKHKHPSLQIGSAHRTIQRNIVLWINQRNYFNLADLLGKFDIDKDHVSRWMELAQ